MFDNNVNRHDEETSFAEAYKSQILNPPDEEEETSSLPKILGILLLMVLISGLSIFGYKYITQNQASTPPPIEEIELPQGPMMIDNIEDLEEPEPTSSHEKPHSPKVSNKPSTPQPETQVQREPKNIDTIADQVKIELSKEIDRAQANQQSIALVPKPHLSPSQKGEDTYLEQLAELSKEIDGEGR